ncbi:hypothetical protein PAEPH01_0786 [Pancytospora epiphaga]|nr:hypothetical protein PAEPH01_0786 [Pancytospora epiphaga]
MDEGPLKDSTEYRYHRDNITAMLNNPEKTHLHGSAVAKIMKGELQQIVMLMLERSIIPTERVEMKYPELLVVVSTLERIADDLSGRICVNLESMSDDLISILDKLVSEMEKDPNIDVDLLNKLKMHRVPIEGMANSVTKLDAFKLVVLLAQDLRAIVEIKAKRDR